MWGPGTWRPLDARGQDCKQELVLFTFSTTDVIHLNRLLAPKEGPARAGHQGPEPGAEHSREVVSLNEFQIIAWLFMVGLFLLKSKSRGNKI